MELESGTSGDDPIKREEWSKMLLAWGRCLYKNVHGVMFYFYGGDHLSQENPRMYINFKGTMRFNPDESQIDRLFRYLRLKKDDYTESQLKEAQYLLDNKELDWLDESALEEFCEH